MFCFNELPNEQQIRGSRRWSGMCEPFKDERLTNVSANGAFHNTSELVHDFLCHQKCPSSQNFRWGSRRSFATTTLESSIAAPNINKEGKQRVTSFVSHLLCFIKKVVPSALCNVYLLFLRFHVQTITYCAVICGRGLTMLATTTDASISLLPLTRGTLSSRFTRFIPRSQFRLRKSMECTINIWDESATPEKSSNQWDTQWGRQGGFLQKGLSYSLPTNLFLRAVALANLDAYVPLDPSVKMAELHRTVIYRFVWEWPSPVLDPRLTRHYISRPQGAVTIEGWGKTTGRGEGWRDRHKAADISSQLIIMLLFL